MTDLGDMIAHHAFMQFVRLALVVFLVGAGVGACVVWVLP